MEKFSKKILAFLLQIFIMLSVVIHTQTVAATTGEATTGGTTEKKATANKILVSEKPLGAKNCYCAKINNKAHQSAPIEERYPPVSGTVSGTCGNEVKIHERLYVCDEATLGEMIQGIVVWIIQIALLLGVLATAALGVAWGVAGGDDPEYKKKLKEWLI